MGRPSGQPARGRRLKRSEWPEPVAGTLFVGDHGFLDGRPMGTKATLSGFDFHKRELLLPIFDPVLWRTFEAGFLLRGIELATHDGGIHEHLQVWYVVPGIGPEET